jgi:hypothetical protein
MNEKQFDAKMKALISEYIAWMPESYLDELTQAIEQRRDAIQRRVMTPIEIPAWPKGTVWTWEKASNAKGRAARIGQCTAE